MGRITESDVLAEKTRFVLGNTENFIRKTVQLHFYALKLSYVGLENFSVNEFLQTFAKLSVSRKVLNTLKQSQEIGTVLIIFHFTP
jgi:hypothetical protein